MQMQTELLREQRLEVPPPRSIDPSSPACSTAAACQARDHVLPVQGRGRDQRPGPGTILYFLLVNGLEAISWEFLTQAPRNSMTEGGILPCIVGTVILAVGSIVVALPWGMATAIYLHEYAKPGPCPTESSGWPSIILPGCLQSSSASVGLAFFVTYMGFKVSILSGVLTLGVLILPVVIGTAEEALGQCQTPIVKPP
jgi:ABC-type phosphate transport system permease subunit